MTCGRCEMSPCHRAAREHGLRLCRTCYEATVGAALGDEIAAWNAVLDSVAESADRLRWNQGRGSTAAHVGLEDGRVRLDLHGLDGQLAAQVACCVASRITTARLPAIRLVVGEGGDDILRDAAIRALADTLPGPVAILPGRGHLDVVAGPVRLVDLVAEGRPRWRDPPRRPRRSPRPSGPRPGWRALVRVVGRLRARLAARSARR